MIESDFNPEDLPELSRRPTIVSSIHNYDESDNPNEPLTRGQEELLQLISQSGKDGFNIDGLPANAELNLRILYKRGKIKLVITSDKRFTQIIKDSELCL